MAYRDEAVHRVPADACEAARARDTKPAIHTFGRRVLRWHRTFAAQLFPFRDAWRYFPLGQKVACQVLDDGRLSSEDLMVIAWTAAAFLVLDHKRPNPAARTNYAEALKQLNRGRRALDLASRAMVLWPASRKRLEGGQRVFDRLEDHLISEAGSCLTGFPQIARQYDERHREIFGWVVQRILVERGGRPKRQAFREIAKLEERVFHVAVDRDTIRKRHERLRASDRRKFCAIWDMLLFEILDLAPTFGLFKRRQTTPTWNATTVEGMRREIEQAYPGLNLTMKTRDDLVRHKRVLRDFEKARVSVERCLRPFQRLRRAHEAYFDEWSRVGTDLDEAVARYTRLGADPEAAASTLARVAELLTRWLQLTDQFPHVTRSIRAVGSVYGTSFEGLLQFEDAALKAAHDTRELLKESDLLLPSSRKPDA